MKNSHRNRMQQIANVALPPKGTKEYDLITKYFKRRVKTEDDNKYVESAFQQSLGIVTGQRWNGAGHQTDQAIRHFHWEYNYRCWEHGLFYSFPSSFNIAESFFRYHNELNTFIILDEVNHLFFFPDFIDWYTSCDESFEYQESLDSMEEGIIYTFDNLLDPADMLYSVENGKEIAVAGFAIVRFGAEVTVMCVGGERADIEQETGKLPKEAAFYKPVKFKDAIQPDPSVPIEAVTLDSKMPLWKLLTLIRFDIKEMSKTVRYLFHDIGNAFLVTSDDHLNFFDIEDKPIHEAAEEMIAHDIQKIMGYNALFDLCASALFLPLYFSEHSDDVVVERFETDYAKEARKTSFQKIKKIIPVKNRIAHRNVNVLRGKSNDREVRETIYSAQHFHTETSGYWKTLGPGKYGTDKAGNPLHGRTWIFKKLSWMEADEPSMLRAKGRNYHSLPEGPNPGYIYIMRSPLHEKGVFKIGLTTRSAEIRADELSSATGVPGKLFVINQWPVSDCKTIEQEIHHQLAEYRVDPRREFFEGNLEYFIDIVGSIIRESASEQYYRAGSS